MKKTRFKSLVSVVVMLAVMCSFCLSAFAATYLDGAEIWGLGNQNLSFTTPTYNISSGTFTCKLWLGTSKDTMYAALYNDSNKLISTKSVSASSTYSRLVWTGLQADGYYIKFYFNTRQPADRYVDCALYDGNQQ